MFAERGIQQEHGLLGEGCRLFDLEIGTNASVNIVGPVFAVLAADGLDLRRRREGEGRLAAGALAVPDACVGNAAAAFGLLRIAGQEGGVGTIRSLGREREAQFGQRTIGQRESVASLPPHPTLSPLGGEGRVRGVSVSS